MQATGFVLKLPSLSVSVCVHPWLLHGFAPAVVLSRPTQGERFQFSNRLIGLRRFRMSKLP
jgi:hypothetical protein